jgi:4-diphosphocytidyl-2-C-methyl-D-erythritol kinase
LPASPVPTPGIEAGAALRLTARAKINLYLHIVGRRADGYHLLDSLIAFAEWGDQLTLTSAPGLSLRLEGAGAAALGSSLPTPDDNLVLRAARLLAEAAGSVPGAALVLDKRLPTAAGIGGGSSDAAAALAGLSRLWRLSLSRAELARLGCRLGADVPACLCQPAPVFAGGVGEVLTPAPVLPAAGLLLVNPGTALSTPAVFRARRGDWGQPARFEQAPKDAAELAALLAARRNDLEPAAISLAPEVDRVLATLRALPGMLLARMSGSGATCFGLFADRDRATEAATALRGQEPAWWVQATALSGSG